MNTHVRPPERAPLNEVARWYGLDYAKLYGLVRAGTIPAENQNAGTEKRASYWVRTADVDTWLDGLRSA